ncbi:hypothetical protein DCAR_0101885 [Daucus carota subsp. sativus]|uniref:RNA helicase n=1 Tax=Daucus carota subsp. sativus TaxID=79200 RepID=A0AAF0W3V4_DAUCS|nr:hypothetical protein DCAR_0101885 [Daucus carota subsp. sativus]
MASSSTILNISSPPTHQNPLKQLPKKPTSILPQSSQKWPHFTALKASFKPSFQTSSFVASAVATPSSSVLSEEAFKGLGEIERYGDDLSLSESDDGFGDVGSNKIQVNVDEIDIIKLGLPQKLVQTLADKGITELFPIQRAVLVPALEGKDIIARAKTGTGKTLAFGIPIIKRLTEDDQERGHSSRLPRALVLAPTRELAKQVENEIKESAPYLSTVCVYGGVPYGQQQNALSSGVDVVVGTPGRIIDLIDRNTLKLGEIQFLVLDEADQMLAVGFEEAVEMILQKIPTERQSMLFSATMPSWVKQLSRKYLNSPMTIDLVGNQDEKLAEGIKLYALASTSTSKRAILSDLVTVYAKGGKTIVFTQTKRDADEVSLALTSSIASEALHGDISQHQRERTLNGFRQGKFTVLVATDVASRGLDIPNVDLVIHYELPNDAETFVHRSGRTGRAGKEGSAILMFTNNERRKIRSIERDVGCNFEFISPPALPALLDDGPVNDNYGRYSNRGGMRGGGSRGGSGYGSPRGRRGGRFSDGDDERRGGSWGAGRGGARGGGGSSRSRSSGIDWLISDRGSSPLRSYGKIDRYYHIFLENS